jgi:hypothetical protein
MVTRRHLRVKFILHCLSFKTVTTYISTNLRSLRYQTVLRSALNLQSAMQPSRMTNSYSPLHSAIVTVRKFRQHQNSIQRLHTFQCLHI